MARMRAAGHMLCASAGRGGPEPSTAAKDPGFEASCIARLAPSAERKALNLVVVGSSPTVAVASIYFFVFNLVVCLLFKSIK